MSLENRYHCLTGIEHTRIAHLNIFTEIYQVAQKNAPTLTVFKDTRYGINVTLFGDLIRLEIELGLYAYAICHT